MLDEMAEEDEESLELTSEFATVQVRPVETRNGTRLEIVSRERGRRIRLSSIELESLTWQNHDTFSEFLETPFGPEE